MKRHYSSFAEKRKIQNAGFVPFLINWLFFSNSVSFVVINQRCLSRKKKRRDRSLRRSFCSLAGPVNEKMGSANRENGLEAGIVYIEIVLILRPFADIVRIQLIGLIQEAAVGIPGGQDEQEGVAGGKSVNGGHHVEGIVVIRGGIQIGRNGVFTGDRAKAGVAQVCPAVGDGLGSGAALHELFHFGFPETIAQVYFADGFGGAGQR